MSAESEALAAADRVKKAAAELNSAIKAARRLDLVVKVRTEEYEEMKIGRVTVVEVAVLQSL